MIELQHVYKAYKGKSVLVNVSLTIRSGEFFVLIGSSGCGKTTLLKTINKLNALDKGEVLIDGTSVQQIKVSQLPRLVGYVVQEGGLFPHMTVEENIALTMQISRYPKEQISARIDELLRMVNLDPKVYRNQFPSQLSGGQKQRVGVARAFAADPPIILMDEPFSALDPMTRAELQDEIHRLQQAYHKTIVFVTHDMDEAIKLADRICIIQNGRVIQCDTPEQILKHPANRYIDAFIGKNRLWDNPAFIKARDIMRPRPVTVSCGRTVMQALQIMRQNNVDSLMVTGSGNVFFGMVWLKDLSAGVPMGDRIDKHLSKDYISVSVDDSLKDILTALRAGDSPDFGAVPVLDAGEILCGFLTKSSLLATLSHRFVPERTEEVTAS